VVSLAELLLRTALSRTRCERNNMPGKESPFLAPKPQHCDRALELARGLSANHPVSQHRSTPNRPVAVVALGRGQEDSKQQSEDSSFLRRIDRFRLRGIGREVPTCAVLPEHGSPLHSLPLDQANGVRN
jgi:hypothetical protein